MASGSSVEFVAGFEQRGGGDGRGRRGPSSSGAKPLFAVPNVVHLDDDSCLCHLMTRSHPRTSCLVLIDVGFLVLASMTCHLVLVACCATPLQSKEVSDAGSTGVG